MACWRKSGVESMSTFLPAYCTSMLGRVRLSCGSAEEQTAHWQPMVGTPIEVPLPRTVSVAFIRYAVLGIHHSVLGARCSLLLWWWSRGDCLGQFHKGHAEFEEAVLKNGLLAVADIAFGLFLKNRKHVDGMASADDVRLLWGIAFAQRHTELHH